MQYGNDNRLLTQAFLEDKLSQDQNNDLTAGTFDLSARPSADNGGTKASHKGNKCTQPRSGEHTWCV